MLNMNKRYCDAAGDEDDNHGPAGHSSGGQSSA